MRPDHLAEKFLVHSYYVYVTNAAAMFSLQKLLGKDDKFFKLMEGSAEEARASIQGLAEMLAAPEEKRSLDAFVGAKSNLAVRCRATS